MKVFSVLIGVLLVAVVACEDPTENSFTSRDTTIVNINCPDVPVIVCEIKWHPKTP